MMAELPSGTVTFLFTDIEGSTTRWERQPQAMRQALDRHDALLQAGITAHGGVVLTERGEGDSFFALFARPSDAVAAACSLQRALVAEPWPQEVAPIRVRMALHTGEAGMWEGQDYRGTAVNRCARLRAAAHGGQVLLSGATHELVRDALPAGITLRDLGLHRLKDLTRPEHIFQVLHEDLPAQFPLLQTLDRQRHNLPVPLTPLIGREQEVAAVRQRLLEPATRLLTLTGAGGTGKTRLAVQVAAEVLDVFPDGVCFVNLAPLSDLLLVVPTIAQTLGLREAGGQPLHDSLYSFLQHKQLLLVLDNFEQVLEAAPEVADLLSVCANVRALVTSRAALHLRGEHRYAVPPLTLPELAPPPPLDRLTQYEAVRLFIERASDVKADFTVTNATAPAVAEICVRLDGLPLAIELAAARVRLFTPPTLLARLSHRLDVVTGGARDLPARQRTLRATIDWSYSLLVASEQALLARLGVFVGGATLEAITAVCNLDGELDVLQGVESLLEINLLRQVGEEEPRFVMLETIHEYARERLDESGEGDVLRRQHVAYYLAMAEQAEAGLHGPQQGEWLLRLEEEHGNVRAALAWCLDVGEHSTADHGAVLSERTAAGVRLAGALWWFWYLRAHRREGLQWLERALVQSTGAVAAQWSSAPGAGAAAAIGGERQGAPADPRAARAKVALGAARIAWEQHQSEPAKKSAAWCRARLEESVALYREIGDRYGIADALSAFGLLAHRQVGTDRRFGVDGEQGTALLEESLTLAREAGEPWLIACVLERLASTAVLQQDAERARARAEAEESLRLFQEAGDTLEIAIVQRILGQIALYERDYARARAAFSADLATTRMLGDTIGIAVGLTNLGDVARQGGDLTGAAALYEQSLALWREQGSVNWGMPWALLGLGDICLQRSDHAAARACFAESLKIARQEDQIAASLEALAGLAAMQGQPARALRLAGAAAALRDRLGWPPWPAEQAALACRLAVTREVLNVEGQTAAWADGQALPVEQVIAEALETAQDG